MNDVIFNFVNAYINNKYHEYIICDFIHGHIGNKGIMKNPIYKITNNEQDVIYLLYCEKNTICELDQISYDIYHSYNTTYTLNNNGKYNTYFKSGNGYIYGTNKLSIHQIIMNLYGQGNTKNQFSIDHIDRDPLNNKYTNLRIVDFETQQKNKKGVLLHTKRDRKYNAQELPNGITHDMIPKYVYYCSEIMNKNTEKEYTREYFRIEKHPKLTKKCISSSKSVNIGILEKLQEIIHKLENLNNDIVEPTKKYPKYITVKSSKRTKGKVEIIFDRRYQGKRQGLKKTINDTDDPWDFMELFSQSIMDKYDYNINQSP